MSLDNAKLKTIGHPPQIACQSCGKALPLTREAEYFRMLPFCTVSCKRDYQEKYQKEHSVTPPVVKNKS